MNAGMSDSRWHYLMSDDDAPLTEQELLDGWHFCTAMDGLLANSNDPNGDCFCELNLYRNKPLTPS